MPTTINDLILLLEEIKLTHGNLPIMTEYDATYSIGVNAEVSVERNPDDYNGDKIKVLFIS